MDTTSRRESQLVGNNDKQRFIITEQRVQDRQTTSGMCYGENLRCIPLDWGINNYDVYNRNELIETVIFYTYISFI
jgi:hypothetical protein